jgi:hypothetical protein
MSFTRTGHGPDYSPGIVPATGVLRRDAGARACPAEHARAPAGAVDALVANKEQSVLPLLKSSIVRRAMQEGTQVQARALLREGTEAEAPLFENGLIPSPDGLFWSSHC